MCGDFKIFPITFLVNYHYLLQIASISAADILKMLQAAQE